MLASRTLEDVDVPQMSRGCPSGVPQMSREVPPRMFHRAENRVLKYRTAHFTAMYVKLVKRSPRPLGKHAFAL